MGVKQWWGITIPEAFDRHSIDWNETHSNDFCKVSVMFALCSRGMRIDGWGEAVAGLNWEDISCVSAWPTALDSVFEMRMHTPMTNSSVGHSGAQQIIQESCKIWSSFTFPYWMTWCVNNNNQHQKEHRTKYSSLRLFLSYMLLISETAF